MHVAGPAGGTLLTGVEFIEDDLEHQIGPIGLGAGAGVGVEQGGEVQVIDGVVDEAGGMILGQAAVDVLPLG